MSAKCSSSDRSGMYVYSSISNFSSIDFSLQCPSYSKPLVSSGVGSYSLLQGIFPTQGSNPGLLHCRLVFYYLNNQGSPFSSSLGKWENMHFLCDNILESFRTLFFFCKNKSWILEGNFILRLNSSMSIWKSAIENCFFFSPPYFCNNHCSTCLVSLGFSSSLS